MGRMVSIRFMHSLCVLQCIFNECSAIHIALYIGCCALFVRAFFIYLKVGFIFIITYLYWSIFSSIAVISYTLRPIKNLKKNVSRDVHALRVVVFNNLSVP